MDLTKNKAWIGVALYLTVSALGAGIWVYRTQGALETERQAVEGLQGEVAGLREVVDQRDALNLQLGQLTECVKSYVTILPVPEIATEERLLSLVQLFAERSGVQFQHIHGTRESKKRARDKRKQAFTEVPVKIDLSGTHHELLRFINMLERERSLIRVNAFTLTTPGNGLIFDETEPLRLQLEISTFRYRI